MISFLALKLGLFMEQNSLLLLIIPFLGLRLLDLLFKLGRVGSIMFLLRIIGFDLLLFMLRQHKAAHIIMGGFAPRGINFT